MTAKRNSNSIVAGLILILLGLLVLLGQLFRGSIAWDSYWPVFIIGAGALFFAGMWLGGKPAAGLAIPGSIITTTGSILLVQNLTDHWESWAYAWTLIGISIGLGTFIRSLYSGDNPTRQAGLRLMRNSFILFLIFGAFFEMVFASGYTRTLSQYFFPVALILVGVYLVLSRKDLLNSFRREARNNPEESSSKQ